MALALCVVCASPRGVGVGRRLACWAQWLCEVVRVAIAVVEPTLVTPDGREGWEDEGTILWHSLVGLCRCGDGPL